MAQILLTIGQNLMFESLSSLDLYSNSFDEPLAQQELIKILADAPNLVSVDIRN